MLSEQMTVQSSRRRKQVWCPSVRVRARAPARLHGVCLANCITYFRFLLPIYERGRIITLTTCRDCKNQARQSLKHLKWVPGSVRDGCFILHSIGVPWPLAQIATKLVAYNSMHTSPHGSGGQKPAISFTGAKVKASGAPGWLSGLGI